MGTQHVVMLFDVCKVSGQASKSNANAPHLEKDGVGGEAALRVGASRIEGIVAVWPCSNSNCHSWHLGRLPRLPWTATVHHTSPSIKQHPVIHNPLAVGRSST